MIPKKSNPPMPEQQLTRQMNIHGFIEGEDFTCECPPWCEPMEPGAFPTEEGWYLAVSHFSGAEDPVPKCEPVLVSLIIRDGVMRWIVHEAGNDPKHPAELGNFWWVGKIKLPNCINLREPKP